MRIDAVFHMIKKTGRNEKNHDNGEDQAEHSENLSGYTPEKEIRIGRESQKSEDAKNPEAADHLNEAQIKAYAEQGQHQQR